MNTMDVICSRKSICSYNGESITEAELQAILKAAYAAPVGMGAYDSLQLNIVTNKEYLSQIDEAAAVMFQKPGIHPLYGAPTLIIVSTKLSGGAMDNTSYSNAACIIHNMVLEAVEIGVGACYIWGAIMALNSKPELVAKLNLPEGYTPCCAISLGHTDEQYAIREISSERIKTVLFD